MGAEVRGQGLAMLPGAGGVVLSPTTGAGDTSGGREENAGKSDQCRRHEDQADDSVATREPSIGHSERDEEDHSDHHPWDNHAVSKALEESRDSSGADHQVDL